jgi:hypothetical protein
MCVGSNTEGMAGCSAETDPSDSVGLSGAWGRVAHAFGFTRLSNLADASIGIIVDYPVIEAFRGSTQQGSQLIYHLESVHTGCRRRQFKTCSTPYYGTE